MDLLLGLVAALLLHRGLRLLPVPLLRLLMRLSGLGKLLCLVYLDQVRHVVDGRQGGQGDNQQFIIGLDCPQSCSRLEKERPNNRKQRHHPKTRLTVWGRCWSRAVHQRRPPGTSRKSPPTRLLAEMTPGSRKPSSTLPLFRISFATTSFLQILGGFPLNMEANLWLLNHISTA